MGEPSASDSVRPLGVALLGSTGSIGLQSLDVLESAEPGRFNIVALATGRDVSTFQVQVDRLEPRVVTMADAEAGSRLRLPGSTEWLGAADAMEQMASRDDVDVVVVASGGIVSLRPVLAALSAGKVVATANKETLVAGGHLVMPLAAERAAEVAASDPSLAMASALAWLRPIDSEHSAIWQCLVGEHLDTVERLILTASGGPFRSWTRDELDSARPEDALAHPTWDMGSKITIDSATLMNKGLEVIEAHWLYDVAYDSIDVVVHPQSLIHSLVEFVDGSTKAQLGLPDMRIPIQYAVSYPARSRGPAPRLDLIDHPEMTFEAADEHRFPALSIAREAGRSGPGSTAALIAADEVAVERFLEGSLKFPQIAALTSTAIDRFAVRSLPSLQELEEIDVAVRQWARTATPEEVAGA